MDAQFLLREYVGESLVVVPSEQLLQVRNSMIRYLSLAAILVLTVLNPIQGGEPVTLETVVDPGPNDLSEPIAQDYSLEKAVHFLDSASLQWQKQRKCFTCHTNLAYLYARPAISSDVQAHREVRQFAEELVQNRWEEQGPRWDAEVIATAAALAFNDANTTHELHPVTKTALDRMWTIQREDGGWEWLKCDWPPFEHDDHYGVTLAALAVGVAPEDYVNSPAAQEGIAGIRSYLAANPPENLHHRAMMLWAGKYLDDLVSDEDQQKWVNELLDVQKEDGGWSAATLGEWARADDSEQDTVSSDGYGTGFVLFALQQAGVPMNDERMRRGVEWLKANQRESGRWIARSLYKDNKHYLSHAGSAFAVMALAGAEE